MTTHLSVLVFPWIAALILTPWIERWATRHGWLDHPRGHKLHGAAVPVLGGLAVFAAMALGLGLALPLAPAAQAGLLGKGSLLALAAGIAAILTLGVYDDLRDLRASRKLAFQVVIAGLTWGVGFRCGAIELPWGWEIVNSPVVSFVITVGWIVILTNAFNLIDGLDGLAVGIGIVATLTIFVLASGYGATVPVVGALALAGALSGVLRYNLPPARIFLGDAGSMGIGYTIAVLALGSAQKSPTAVALVVPLIALGVPLLDTIVAVLRRLGTHLQEEGRSGLGLVQVARAVFRADRGHIHHLLMRLGWSVRGVLFALYALSAGLGVLGLWTRGLGAEGRWSLWLSIVLVGILTFRWVERRVERKEKPPRNQVTGEG